MECRRSHNTSCIARIYKRAESIENNLRPMTVIGDKVGYKLFQLSGILITSPVKFLRRLGAYPSYTFSQKNVFIFMLTLAVTIM